MAELSYIRPGDPDRGALINALVGHRNLADYVATGVQIQNVSRSQGDHGAIDVTAGKAFVLLPNIYAGPPVDQTLTYALVGTEIDRTEGLPLASSDTNEIYVHAKFGREDPEQAREVEAELVAVDPNDPSDSPPTSTDAYGNTYEDTLKVAEVRPLASPADTPPQVELFNRDPNITAETVETDDLNVNRSIEFPGGSEPLYVGSTINNRNEFYHYDPSDPANGKVHYAYQADIAIESGSADYAEEAGHADNADHATLSETTETVTYRGDTYTIADIVERAGESYSSFGKPLYYYENDTLDQRPGFNHRFDASWQQIRLLTYIQNTADTTDSLTLQVNGSSANNYRNVHFDIDNPGNPDEDQNPGEYRPDISIRYGRTSNGWRLGRAASGSWAVGIYSLFVPPAIGGWDATYPILSKETHATSPNVEGSHLMGELEENRHRSIDSIRVQEPFGSDLRCIVQVFGLNPWSTTSRFPKRKVV